MKKKRIWFRVLFIALLVAFGAIVMWPGGFKFSYGDRAFEAPDWDIKQGLDLQGGTHIVYRANLSEVEEGKKDDAMKGLKEVINTRINSLGVTEPVIQTTQLGGEHRLIVELPGVSDVNEAMDTIGETAELKFKELKGEGENAQFVETELTGKYLEDATQEYDQNTNEPIVSITFNDEGAKLFEQITERNVGKPLAIELDGQIVQAPNVNEKIAGGRAQISGGFDLGEAKKLAIQLDAGALPVPVEVIQQRTVGATLGQEAVKMSIFAGIVGIILVMIFMAAYYRLPGLIAGLALIFYSLFVLSLFKLIGVTITLSGVAAFILSIGMAVDANILIFERMKEELRAGRSLFSAIEIGFSRAWTSIRDSNISSIITALILFIFGSGIIRGFAVVLIIGVLVSMFTAINVTKIFLRLATKRGFFRKSKFYIGADKKKGAKV